MRVLSVCVGLMMTMVSWGALATEFPVQARLFAGATAIKPEALNTEMTAQGLKNMETLTQVGVEITYPALPYVNLGFRYSRRLATQDETNSDAATEYLASLNQDSLLALVRLTVLKSDFFRLDAFAGAGGSNTSYKIKTASQDGELTRREGNDWFATPYFSYGGSVAVGYKWVFLALEAGFESNKVDGFKRVGTVNDNVQAIDLSGSYVLLALVFDGIPGKFK